MCIINTFHDNKSCCCCACWWWISCMVETGRVALTVIEGIPGKETGVTIGNPLETGPLDIGGGCMGVCAKLLISNVGTKLGVLWGLGGAEATLAVFCMKGVDGVAWDWE